MAHSLALQGSTVQGARGQDTTAMSSLPHAVFVCLKGEGMCTKWAFRTLLYDCTQTQLTSSLGSGLHKCITGWPKRAGQESKDTSQQHKETIGTHVYCVDLVPVPKHPVDGKNKAIVCQPQRREGLWSAHKTHFMQLHKEPRSALS